MIRQIATKQIASVLICDKWLIWKFQIEISKLALPFGYCLKQIQNKSEMVQIFQLLKLVDGAYIPTL